MASIAWRRAMRRFQTIAKVMKTAKNVRVLTRNPKRRVDAALVVLGVVDGEGTVDVEGCVADMGINGRPL